MQYHDRAQGDRAMSRAVILAGGSEIVATALVEELSAAGIPVAVVSLGLKSLLRGCVPSLLYAEIPWPPTDSSIAAGRLEQLLRQWGASELDPWTLFASEDGGLRMLMENRETLGRIARVGQARRLGHLGGLDKAELFSFLARTGCQHLIAPTEIVDDITKIDQAVQRLGGDCVIKPSLKPLSMQLRGMRAKAFISRDFENVRSLITTLENAWPISKEWLVQERLRTPPTGELVFWAVRDAQGRMMGITALEVWKYPKAGGTGCWLKTCNRFVEPLWPIAEKILAAIDFVGLGEMPFLLDSDGHWRLLEFNPRAWLQIALPAAAGCGFALAAHRSLLRGTALLAGSVKDDCSWVNPERLLLAALSGEQGPRASALVMAGNALRQADAVAMYDSTLPRIPGRWLIRILGKAWRSA